MNTNQRNNSTQNQQADTTSGKRGFASMDEERQREIARKGGQAAHAKGTAHEFSSEEARAAGSKGGRSHGSQQDTTTQANARNRERTEAE